MDKLKGIGSSLVGNIVDKSKHGVNFIKDNYLNKIYDFGNRKFAVKKLIAEGGFGFVFLVKEFGTERQYALKRILVQDKERVGAINNEINLMKTFMSHPHLVNLEDHRMIDNRTEKEFLLLLEFCPASLLEVVKQGALRNEQEIYNVFSQVCEGVARLHANNPPISHRDLKIENILYGEDGKWKLCDFGSATTATYLPTTERERGIAEEDINRNTTMMYRAPEMVDLYRRQPINEKVDVWALGCVLFKMAYGVDAFDGGLGIMNARYTFPEYRRTTAEFEEFIGFMLNPDPTARPSIQRVRERLASLRKVPLNNNVHESPHPHPSANASHLHSSSPTPRSEHEPANSRPSTAPIPGTSAAAAPSAYHHQQPQSLTRVPSNPQQQQQQQQQPTAKTIAPVGNTAQQRAAPPTARPQPQQQQQQQEQQQPQQQQQPQKDLLDFGDLSLGTAQPVSAPPAPTVRPATDPLAFLELPPSKQPSPSSSTAAASTAPRPPAAASQAHRQQQPPPQQKPAAQKQQSAQKKQDAPDLLDFSDPPPPPQRSAFPPSAAAAAPIYSQYPSPPAYYNHNTAAAAVPSTQFAYGYQYQQQQLNNARVVDPLAQFKPMQMPTAAATTDDDFDPISAKKTSSAATTNGASLLDF